MKEERTTPRSTNYNANSGKNGYMLGKTLTRNGYDWWWHSFVGIHRETKEKKPFFIEYFVTNPALGGKKPILGQNKGHKEKGRRPSYAMIKAGAWGKDAAQIHNFYGIRDFSASRKREFVKIGPNIATESRLKGSVKVTEAKATAHPEYMSDPGEMQWDLHADKILSYDVGIGSSKFARLLNVFQMFWHVAGMFTKYEGKVVYNGEEYLVEPTTSYGYQDKNWGTGLTNPWVWLNCNNFTSRTTGEPLPLTSLVAGGAKPVVFGFPLPRKLLIAFYYRGQLYEWNFSKIWMKPKQKFKVSVTDDLIKWNILARNRWAMIEINFKCPKSHMLLFNYENPRGEKKHNKLWNGGHASGWVKLYHRKQGEFELVDTLDGNLAGCEYGKY